MITTKDWLGEILSIFYFLSCALFVVFTINFADPGSFHQQIVYPHNNDSPALLGTV